MSAQPPYIGQPVERIEDLRLLRGRGTFVDDLTRPGMLHAAILRSPQAHGRITHLDVGAARALPGVVAVITALEIGHPVPRIPVRLAPLPSLETYTQPVIAADLVRYVGEPVALVVAESADIAEDALELIDLRIDPLPPVVTTATALEDATRLFADASNCAQLYTASIGDAWQDFADAVTVRKQMSTQRHTAVTMEMRGWLAEWDAAAQHMTVYGAAKVAWATRATLARQLGLEEDAVDLIEVDVGGSFGMRGEFYPEDFLVPFAARHTGRPVKWAEDRREHLLACNHAREFDADLELVCARDGRILALRGRTNCNAGAYIRANATIAPRNVGQFLGGPYRVPNLHVQTAMLVTNKTPTGTYRGPGRFEADYFRERLFDAAAQALEMDPVAFRRRNLLTRSEIPADLPVIDPPRKEEALDSGDYHAALDRCLEAFGWVGLQHLQGRQVDGRWHGLACACFIEGGAAGPAEHARMVLERDGMVSIYVGSSLVGQGLETVLLQIAADALGLPMARLRIFHGSTTYLKQGYGSFHSRSTAMGGAAVMDAAANLLELLRARAGLRLNCAPGDVVLDATLARAPGGATVSLEALAAGVPIEAAGLFENHRHTYAYGAHAAHVAVDVQTGHVAVLDYLAVEDVGRIINPRTLKGQVIGAVVQGLGGTLLEHLVYDSQGQMLSGSFVDYLLPSATEFPVIRSIETGDHPALIGPLGVKGAGEGGVVPVGGVIANAVAAALRDFGAMPDHLPLTPAKIWRMAGGAGR